MRLDDLITLFRKQVDDKAKPYLWDDVEILQYVIDAQDMFVRKTGGIADSTTRAITDVTVAPGISVAKHSPYILRIRSAQLVTAQRALKMASEGDLSTMVVEDYGFLLPAFLKDTDYGQVTAAILGVKENALRWFRVPETTADPDICRMNVYRLPYPRITRIEDCLEIDEQHHLHLIKWVKHLAYSKEDAETYDRNLAESNKELFTEYCDQAKSEKERQRYKPRVVQYGGI